METTGDKRFVYEFGKFVLDPFEKTLLIDGTPVHLPAKEFETLLLLVQHNGRALTKERMMSVVWHDAFVEESNLAKQVSKLRKLLEGSGDVRIETIPKHGYRFSADLKLVESGEQTPIIAERRTVKRVTVALDTPDNGRPVLPPKPPTRTLRIIVALVALAGIAIVGAIWYRNRSTVVRPSEIKSIAVLPLRSLTPDANLDVLALGLTDSLITELGSVRHLVVRPIGAVRGLSTGTDDPLDLGRRLNVDAVLDGTIQEAGGKLRINARLISTVTGEQVWAEKFDNDLTNVFDVQDRISEQTARALTAMLSAPPTTGEERLTKRYTQNPAAFDAYLKGRYHWNKRTESDFRSAIEQFQSAVAIDPNYALAYAGLADSYILLAVWGTEPPERLMELAKQSALKALAVDSDLAEARTSLAFITWVYDWNFAAADAEFNRAIELNPNYATAHHWRAYYLVSTGRGDEAIAAINRARELEGPLSLGIMTDVGEILCWAGKYDDAINHLTEVVKTEPNYAVAHYELGIAYLMKNRNDEATAELERARDLEGDPRMISVLAYAYGVAGRKSDAEMLIAELETEATRRYVSPFSLAVAYAGLNDADTALLWLERAKAERSDAMGIVKVHPLLLKLHSNERFQNLIREVGYSN
jgi:TolB-like protein/DNA-binding winged helix-turn-helix (wHTH) protein/Flp pilus assembly protein TadD